MLYNILLPTEAEACHLSKQRRSGHSVFSYSTSYLNFTEGQIPKGAIYVGSQRSQEGGVEHTDMYYMAPAPVDTVVQRRTKEVGFRLIWFINQRALYNHALSVMRCLVSSSSSSVHTTPSHRVRHRNFIFGTNVSIYYFLGGCQPITSLQNSAIKKYIAK